MKQRKNNVAWAASRDQGGRALDIVCFAGNDWWVHNPYTEKQWMRRLAARGRRILFVNSIGIGMPSLSTPRVFRRIGLKFRSLARWLRKSEGIWVLTPIVLPLWSVNFVARFNVLLLTAQVRLLLRVLGIRRPLFWAGLPTAALLLDRIPHSGAVYYIQDNFLAYYDRMSFSDVQEHHDAMFRNADAVICASIGMQADLSPERQGVYYVPHGVADGFLSIGLDGKRTPLPEPMRNIPRPIVGYWGSLEVLQDQELISRMARAHPDWSLVFIGKPMYDIETVDRHGNIHFLGYIPIEEIPRYGIHFDAAVIPWVQSEWVKYSAPVKFREYYAMGKPVVSSYIIEVERALPSARAARSIDEFINAVEEELSSDTPEKREWRRSLVSGQSWEWSAGLVEDVLKDIEPRR